MKLGRPPAFAGAEAFKRLMEPSKGRQYVKAFTRGAGFINHFSAVKIKKTPKGVFFIL